MGIIQYKWNKMKLLFMFVASVLAIQRREIDFDPVINEIREEIFRELYGPLNRVLVCLTQDSRNQLIKHSITELRTRLLSEFTNINVEYHNDVASCHTEIEKDEQEIRTIIAVVAPKPFRLSSNIPMYFYDIPYLMQEDADAFPNGLAPLYRHWHLLKHAFTQHIMRHGWKRIAIISDYSPYSEAFEKELVEHFKKNEFVYNVQRCTVVTTADNCDFHTALHFLRANNAVIIIANVEGRNAQNLVKAAQELLMKSARYVWLVRDWPFQSITSQGFYDIFSISLSPKYLPSYKVNYKQDGPHLNSIWRGLHLISEAVYNTQRKELIGEYYRSITMEMNVTNYEYKGYIRQFTDRRVKLINSLIIDDLGVRPPVPKGPVSKIDDSEEYCMVRSKSYINPCDDYWIMLICVVWLMFILMLFLLGFFFNRCLVWT